MATAAGFRVATAGEDAGHQQSSMHSPLALAWSSTTSAQLPQIHFPRVPVYGFQMWPSGWKPVPAISASPASPGTTIPASATTGACVVSTTREGLYHHAWDSG